MFICTTVDVLANSHPAFSCMFVETCPFLLGCWIYWPVTVHSIFLGLFVCFSIVSVVTSLWFLILFIWAVSLFFLVSLTRGFLFCLSFQKIISWSYESLSLKKKKHKKHLFVSLTFIIFFLLLTLGFVLFFLFVLGGWLGWSFDILFVSGGRPISLWTSLLELLLLSAIHFYKAVFSLSFFLSYFLIPCLISSLTHRFLSSILLNLHVIFFSPHFCFCDWFSEFILLCSEKML